MIVRSLIAMASGATLVLVAAPPAQAATIDRTPESSSHADDGTVYNSVQWAAASSSEARSPGLTARHATAWPCSTPPRGSSTLSGSTWTGGHILATDGNGTVFIGGKFNTVNGVRRNNLAAISASSGAVTSFDPSPKGIVRSLDYADGKVVFGGGFTTVGSTPVTYLAAASASSGALVSGFPSADGVVYVVKTSGASVFVGGEFSRVGGVSRGRVAQLSTSGTVLAYRTTRARRCTTSPSTARGVPRDRRRPARRQLALQDHQQWRDRVAGPHGRQHADRRGHRRHRLRRRALQQHLRFDGEECTSPTRAKKAFTASTTGTTPNPRPWARFNSALGVWDLTAAGGNLYALGVFTKVNGAAVPRIARFQA